MASRMASEDLRWAEKKQKHGVMTTSRGADLKVITGIKLNHDAVHTILFPRTWICRLPGQVGHVDSRKII
jgi:hypothetical protein